MKKMQSYLIILILKTIRFQICQMVKFFVVFLLIFKMTFCQLFPHIIWLYWDSGFNNLKKFQKMCYFRTKYLHQQTDWNIRFVSDQSLPLWLNKTNYIRFKEGNQLISKGFYRQSKADLVRLLLLKEHGGVWLDAAIMLKQNVNWLDHLLNNPRVIHRKIFSDPEVFIHYQHWKQLKQKTAIQMKGEQYYPLFQIQNAFIAAIKQSRYINDMIDQYERILKQKEAYYNRLRQTFHIPNQYSAYFASFRACLINQYRKYFQYQEAQHSNKPVSNPEDHFYKVLIINRDAGMYHGSINQWRVRQFLIDAEGRFGDYETYSMKFSRGPASFLIDILQNTEYKQQQMLRKIEQNVYHFGQQYLTKQYDFFYKYKIREDSPINKYFLFDKKTTLQMFPNVQILKNSQLPFISKVTTLRTFLRTYPTIFQWSNTAVVLVILAQLVFQYYVCFFKASDIFLSALQFLRYKILTSIFLLATIYLQKGLIYSQYQLWMQYSPTAVLVGTIQIIFTIVFFKWFLELGLHANRSNFYWTRILFVVTIQYYFMYCNSAWKYEGQIYSYEILSQLNKHKLEQGVIHLIKIGILILFGNIFTFLRSVFGPFNCQTIHFEQQPLRQNNFRIQQNVQFIKQIQEDSRDIRLTQKELFDD